MSALLKRFVWPLAYRHRARLPFSLQRRFFKSVTIVPKGRVRGRVLLSYALVSAGLPEDHPLFAYHTGPWESNRIISIFNSYGFAVDCINYTNRSFIPRERYDVIFALTGELYRLAAYAQDSDAAVKIWLSGVRAIDFNNAAEMERVCALVKRKPGALYFPKRQEPHERLLPLLMQLADYCLMIGNHSVQDTFPQRFHPKITRIGVTASPLGSVKTEKDFVPSEKEFLWFFGSGAVTKGLDLVLEAFVRHPEWRLNIIGPVDQEPDFLKLYRHELTETPNIVFHGYVNPSSDKFNTVIRRCFAFIAPSATESISTAVATVMQVGLFPIISRQTGVDLPTGAGLYLDSLTVDEVEAKAAEAYRKDAAALTSQIKETQALALREFSREKWLADMDSFIQKVLRERNLIP